MRRTAVVLVAAVAAAGGLSVAQARGQRRAVAHYDPRDLNTSVSMPGNGAFYSNSEYEYRFKLRKGERFVSVGIVDSGDGPISGWVSQWVRDRYQAAPGGGAGTGYAVTHRKFCGQTLQPVEVKPDIPVIVSVNEGTCEDGTPSLPGSGRIVVEFYRSGA